MQPTSTLCPVCGAPQDATPSTATGDGPPCPACGRPGREPATVGDSTAAVPARPAADPPTVTVDRPVPATRTDDEPAPVVPPGYELLGPLGTGGMGSVYLARQVALKRLVALKVIRAGRGGATARARFKAEAEAAARLSHPNAVQIFEVGEHHGELYLVQEYVPGGGLDQKLKGTPLPAADAARLVETLARAIDHAHRMQLVHRDLKPSNILLTEDGTPKVADFGLAKFLDPDAPGVTHNNAILGTPSYMAPEQALGRADVGPPADVYALGAILYECLTGRPPFKAATVLETLDQVRTQEPVAPRSLNPAVPRDLETVCLQCLRKDPARRYASAEAFADDLGRFLRGEPVHARPIGPVERTVRWVRRRPVVAALLALFALTVVGFTAALLESNGRLSTANAALTDRDGQLSAANADLTNREGLLSQANIDLTIKTKLAEIAAKNARDAEQKEREAAEEARRKQDEAQRGEFAATLAQVTLLAETDPTEGLSLLEDPRRCPIRLRDFTWRLLHAACKRDRYSIRVAGGFEDAASGLAPVAFPSPELVLGLARDRDGVRVRRFRAADGLLLGEQLVPGRPAFDAARRYAAVLDPDGTVRRYDLSSGGEPAVARLAALRLPLPAPVAAPRPGQPAGPVHAFSANLDRVAVVDADRAVAVHDTRTGERISRLTVPAVADAPAGEPAGLAPSPTELRFTPAGDRLVAVVQTRAAVPAAPPRPASPAQGAVHVWDARDGRHLHRLSKSGGVPSGIEVSPDGRWLAAGTASASFRGAGALDLFDLGTGQPVDLGLSILRNAPLIRFAPATGETRQFVLLVDNPGMVAGDASVSNTLRIWKLGAAAPESLVSHQAFDAHGILSPDGKTLALGNSDGLRLYDVATGGLLLGTTAQVAKPEDVRNRGQLEKQRPLAFTADSKRLLTTGGRSIKVWDVASRREVLTLPGGGPVTFSADGKRLAARTENNVFTVYSVEPEPTLGRPLPWNEPVRSVSLTPDGRIAAMLGGEIRGFPGGLIPRLLVFDLATNSQRGVVFARGGVSTVSGAAFVGDGRTLATDLDGALQFYDQTGRVARKLTFRPAERQGGGFLFGGFRDDDPLLPVDFTRDGKRLVLGHRQGKVELRDVATNESVALLDAPGPVSCRATLSADDGHVVAGMADGAVAVWDLRTGARAVAPAPHQGKVTAVAVAPGGGRVASTGEDGVLALWDPATNRREALRGIGGKVAALAFSPDGQTLVTGAEDGSVRFWDPATGQSRGTFKRHLYPVRCLAFSADGSALVTGSSGGGRGGELLAWRDDAPVQHRFNLADVDPLVRVALAPDGKRALAETRTGHLRLWDLTTLARLDPPPAPERRPGRPGEPAVELGFHPDGRPIATRREPSPERPHLEAIEAGVRTVPQLTALDLETGRPAPLVALPVPEPPDLGGLPVLPGNLVLSGTGRVSPGGRFVVVSSGFGGKQILYDARSGAVLRETTPRLDPTPGPFPILGSLPGLLFAPGDRFILERSGGQATLLDPAGKVLLQRPVGADDPGPAAIPPFSPDGRRLLLRDPDRKAFRVFDTATGKEQQTLADAAGVQAAAFTPDGDALLLVRPTPLPTLVVWDVATGQERHRHKPDGQEFRRLYPVPGTTTVLVGVTAADRYRLVDWTTGKVVREVDLSLPDDKPTVVGVVRFSPDGRTLVRLSDRSCQVWDVATWTARFKTTAFTRYALTEDGATACLLGEGKKAHVIDTAAGKERAAHPLGDALQDESLQLSPDGRLLYYSVRQKVETIAEVVVRVGPDAKPQASFRDYAGKVNALGLDRAARRAFSAGADRVIHVWDAATGKEIAALRGHADPIDVLALSPDEALLASAGTDAVRLWDLREMKERAALVGNVNRVTTLAFSPDGALLAAAGEDLAVHLWDVASGTLRAVLQGHRGTVRQAAFTRDGATLVTVSDDGTLKVWDVPGAAARPASPAGEADHAVPFVLTPDGQTLLRGLRSGRVERVDLRTGRREPLDESHAGPVLAVALSPDGKVVASGDGTGAVQVRDATTGRRLATWAGHDLPVRALAFSPDGATLASGEAPPLNLFAPVRPGRVLLRDAATGKVRATLWEHKGGVQSLAYTAAGDLVSAGDDGTVLVWDAREGRPRHRLTHAGPVRAVASHPKMAALYTSTAQGTTEGRPIRQWHTGTGTEVTGALPGGMASDLVVSPDGALLVVATADGEVVVWDLKARRGWLALSGRAPVRRLAISADGATLAGMADDGGVEVWDLAAQLGRRLDAATRPGALLAALPVADGQALVTLRAGHGLDLAVVDATTHQDRHTTRLKDPPPADRPFDGVYSYSGMRLPLAASPDGRRAAVVFANAAPPNRPGHEPEVQVWDLEHGEQLHALTGHKLTVAALAFSPDGRRLATAGADGVVRLWDVEAGRLVAELTGHEEALHAVAFSPDGAYLASADGRSRVRLWHVATGRTVHTLDLKHPDDRPIPAGSVVHLAFAPAGPGGYLLATARSNATSGKPGITLWPVASGEGAAATVGPGRPLDGVAPGRPTFLDGGRALFVEEPGEVVDVATGRRLARLGGVAADGFNAPAGRVFAPAALLLAEYRREPGVWAPLVQGGVPDNPAANTIEGGGVVIGAADARVVFGRGEVVTLGTPRDQPDRPPVLLRLATLPPMLKAGPPAEGRVVPLAAPADFVVRHFAAFPDGRVVAAAADGRLRGWSADGEPAFTTPAGPAPTALALAPDGQAFLVGDATGRVRLLAAADGAEQAAWKVEATPTAVALANDGRTVATGHATGEVRLWHRADGSAGRRWAAHAGPVEHLVFSPDDKALATAGAENRVHQWDLATGRQSAWFAPQTRVVRVAYQPDGKRLAVLSLGGLTLWNLDPVKVHATRQTEWALDVAFGPDGKSYALASAQVRGVAERTELTRFDPAVLGRSRRVAPPE